MTLARIRNFLDQYRSQYGELPRHIELQEDEYAQLLDEAQWAMPDKPRAHWTSIYGVPIKVISLPAPPIFGR